MQHPTPTPRQRDILKLLYRYRFLDRKQIQAFLGHKDKKNTTSWLKTLREGHYVDWIYSTDFMEKTKPAIYYLGTAGIRLLSQSDDYPVSELHKRYRDAARSKEFIEHETTLGNCCLNLLPQQNSNVLYEFATKADFANPAHACYFVHRHDKIHTDLILSKTENDSTTYYLCEVFPPSLTRTQISNHLKQYVSFIRMAVWEQGTNMNNPPIFLIACPTLATLIYAKRRMRSLLTEVPDSDERNRIHIRFTTMPDLNQHGITGQVWEEA